MNERKCKNCGASIEHLYNHKCPYCRSFIDFNIELTEEINPRYMYDVELKYIKPDCISNKIIMYFKGKYLKASEALEYTNGNTLMKIDYQSTIPKDVMYAISFDREEYTNIMYQGNIYEFARHFPFEMNIEKFIESLKQFRRARHYE